MSAKFGNKDAKPCHNRELCYLMRQFADTTQFLCLYLSIKKSHIQMFN